MASDFDWPLERAGAGLYRSLSTVERFRWHACELEAPRAVRNALRGRTSTAACCLEGTLLLYGGAQNGNFGPVHGDLLQLKYDGINRLLTVTRSGRCRFCY